MSLVLFTWSSLFQHYCGPEISTAVLASPEATVGGHGTRGMLLWSPGADKRCWVNKKCPPSVSNCAALRDITFSGCRRKQASNIRDWSRHSGASHCVFGNPLWASLVGNFCQRQLLLCALCPAVTHGVHMLLNDAKNDFPEGKYQHESVSHATSLNAGPSLYRTWREDTGGHTNRHILGTRLKVRCHRSLLPASVPSIRAIGQ